MTGGPTLAAVERAAAAALAAAGVADARTDARLLVQHALGLDRGRLLAARDRTLGPEERAQIDRLVARRRAREPVSRILGRREFWSLDFVLSPATLDPRPDSETVVETALALAPDRLAPLRLLDLGTGTGCLLLALLTERPRATGVGVDRNAAAAAVARRNAERLGLADRARFVVGDWGAALGGGFDLIVANPPYVAEAELATLAPEVARFDPPDALAAGPDGLDAYRAIAPDLDRLLAAGGRAVLEVGRGQHAAVAGLLARAGLAAIGARPDLAGVLRAVHGQKKIGNDPAGR